MKKLSLLLMLLFCTVTAAQAQFDKGTKYVNGSLTNFGLSYSGSEKFRMGVNATVGYFLDDCFMVSANAGYDHQRHVDNVSLGVGARYYLIENGIYLGAGAEFDHFTKNSNDVMVPLTVGYAFFLNRYITVEPSLYYKMSLHDFSDNSTFGVQVGIGIYG